MLNKADLGEKKLRKYAHGGIIGNGFSMDEDMIAQLVSEVMEKRRTQHSLMQDSLDTPHELGEEFDDEEDDEGGEYGSAALNRRRRLSRIMSSLY